MILRATAVLSAALAMTLALAVPASAHQSGYCGHGTKWHWAWSQGGWHLEEFVRSFNAGGYHFHVVQVGYRWGEVDTYVAAC